jgi:membrane fusion protein (multidrug efflux system)
MTTLKNIKSSLNTALKYKKSMGVFSTLIIAILIYKYFVLPLPPTSQEEKIVEIEIVKNATIKQTANFIGTIRSRQQTALRAKTNGILTIISTPGQQVKKGDLIARIENEDIERSYKILKEAEEIAKSQFDRTNSLLKSGVSSKNAVEEKRSLLLETQKKRSDTKIALEEIKIYAPFDGIVGLFKFREGSQVNREDIIVQFYDPRSLIVEFDIPLSVAKKVENGGQIFVNDKEYRLTYIQKMLDEETHMCPAYAEIDCPNCVIGTTVDVGLVTQKKQSVIVIPFEAIFLRNGKPFVYVVKDNKARITPIGYGIRDKKRIEIVSGLKEEDQVIPFGHDRLYPDVAVKISPHGSETPINDSKK